jgi:hypothetical protein
MAKIVDKLTENEGENVITPDGQGPNLYVITIDSNVGSRLEGTHLVKGSTPEDALAQFGVMSGVDFETLDYEGLELSVDVARVQL